MVKFPHSMAYRYQRPGDPPLKQRIDAAYPKTTLESRIMKPKAAVEPAPKKTMWKSYKNTGPVGGAAGKARLLQAGGKF